MNTQQVVDYSNLTCNEKSGWIITYDHGVCNDCDNATQEQVDQLISDGYTESFKMFDDDGELYYTGYAKKDVDFDPLDDFGLPNAGCTRIHYYNPVTYAYECL